MTQRPAERPRPEASRPVTAPGAAQEAAQGASQEPRAPRGVERPEVAAGIAGWQARYKADKQQRAQQAALNAQARQLVQTWGALIQGYNAVRFGQGLREQPEAMAALRTRGEAFGMAECPKLAQLLAARDPGRTIRSWLDGHETAMRAELKQERQVEAQRRAERAGPRMSMG